MDLDNMFWNALMEQERFHERSIERMRGIVDEARKIINELDLQPSSISFSTYGSWVFVYVAMPDKASWEALIERCKGHPKFAGYTIQAWGEPQIDMHPVAVVPCFDGKACKVRMIGNAPKTEPVWEIICGDALEEEHR